MTRYWDIKLPPDRVKLSKSPQNAVGICGWTSAKSAREIKLSIVINVLVSQVKYANIYISDLSNLNLLFCSYTMPTFFKGRKKTLDERDLYKALNEHKSGKMTHSTYDHIKTLGKNFSRINQIHAFYEKLGRLINWENLIK